MAMMASPGVGTSCGISSGSSLSLVKCTLDVSEAGQKSSLVTSMLQGLKNDSIWSMESTMDFSSTSLKQNSITFAIMLEAATLDSLCKLHLIENSYSFG